MFIVKLVLVCFLFAVALYVGIKIAAVKINRAEKIMTSQRTSRPSPSRGSTKTGDHP